MGCCHSNASRDGAANAQPANAMMAGHNNPDPAPVPRPAGNARHTGQNRPNQRIREPSPVARSPKNVSNKRPPWTRSHLETERAAFFDTRVTGSPEIWTALRTVSELLRAGDLASGQAILDAANISCPNGRFARSRGRDKNRGGGVYDEQGRLYEVPEWVVTDPKDIVEDKEDKTGVDGTEDSEDAANESDDAAVRREKKGKYPAVDIGEERRVKIRFSDVDTEVVFGSKEPASVLVERFREKLGHDVTLLYRGGPVDPGKTLEAQNWTPGTLLQVFEPLNQGTPS